MKKSLSAILQRTIVSVAFLLFSHGAYANHIIGMELEYAWVSGSTYQVNLVVYGDCGDVTGAFPLLPTSTPAVAVFDSGTYITCLTLSVDSPSTGILTSPVCPADTALTTCTSLSYTIPGIKKFVYSTTYTFSGTSHFWRFVFLGSMGTASFAGRQATITSIIAPGTSVICLIDTLDNTYHNNVSSTFGNTPTPFYCLGTPNNYNPAASNADGDSLVYYLVPGEVGNYPVMICNTIPGTFVTYTGTAWGVQPITDTTPLEVTAGSFSFSHSTGNMAFTPNFTQRGLVVYNIDEYRNDTFIGNSQHELVFVVETCTASPPTASITSTTGPGLATDSVNYTICQNTGAFSFHLNPTGGAGLLIAVSALGIPTGASFTVSGDSTTSPTCTFSWTSTGVPLGTYTFFITYKDNACPINGTQTVAYTITVTAPPVIAATTPACVGLTTTLSPTPAGGIWTSGNTAIATVGSSSGVVTGVASGTSVISYSLGSGCTATTIVTANPIPAAISGATIVCPGSTITLGDTSPGGTWSNSSTPTATISGSLVVTGASPGTTTITYTAGGCSVTKIVTVTALPPAIGGIFSFCQYATTALSDAGGGAWTSSNTSVATVGSTGIVTGALPGASTITYSIGTGCSVSAIVTVNPAPAVITGVLSVCGGSTTVLSDATTGGTWSIVLSSAWATVAPATGVVTAGSPGVPTSVVITYTAPGGCSITATVTVNPAPGTMSGCSGVVCAGQTMTCLESGTGTWSSSNTLVATVGSTTGAVTGAGVSGGTATITYAFLTGCYTTTVITVNPLPSAITPPNPVICIGGNVTLTDTTAGGYWISNNTGIANVDAIFGVANGVSGGVDTIVYILSSTSCYAMVSLTVNPSPPAIGGPGSVCPGASVTLTDGPSGTWSSSNTAVASIGLTTGIAWGGSAAASGTSTTITYTVPGGCTISTVLALSSPPTFPPTHVCVGQSTLIPGTPPGGTWTGSSSDAPISLTGVVTGISSGTGAVTYTEDGCSTTGVVTVNPAPGPILGPRTVCVGSTTLLTDGGTGVWTSSATGVATVGSATGIVSGVVAPGTTTITYSAGGTCTSTVIVTVDALPALFIVSGTGSYCSGSAGGAITLGGSAAAIKYYLYLGGTVIDSLTGTGASLNFGLRAAPGTYTVVAMNTSTGCSRVMTGSATITIIPLPGVYTVSGGGAYCPGGSAMPIVLSGSDAGITYKLSNSGVVVSTLMGTGSPLTFPTASGSGTYIVTAYTATTPSCSLVMAGSAVIAIEPLPLPFPVTGTMTICPGVAGSAVNLGGSAIGVNYQLYNGASTVGPPVPGTGSGITFGPQPAGVYTVIATNAATGCTRAMTGSATITVSPLPVISGATAVCMGVSLPESVAGFSGGTWVSSNISVATVVTATGTVWGVTTGTTNITYTSTSGCTGTTVVTVSPGPGPIGGAGSVCAGATMAETDISPGGSWASSPTATATVVASGIEGGIVTGVRNGTATITYSLGFGCVVNSVVTVTAAPVAIRGSSNICTGACTTLTDGSTGGTWSIGSAVVATVSGSGSVCGVTAGTAVVTYTLGGCTAMDTITANTAPGPITGPTSVCAGSTITLVDATSGGTWTSSAALIGTVDGSGVVLGEIGGVTTITYSLGGMCVATHVVTVNPISPIGGSLGLCVATTTTLTDIVAGGTWVSGNTLAATVTGSGVISGVAPGMSVITYTTAGGCTATVTVTVNLAPGLITGTMQMCIGACTMLLDGVGGGIWTSSNPGVATVNSTMGQVCGTLAGTSVITYSLGFGCTRSAVVTVNPSPAPVRGIFVVCEGVMGTLTDATTGGTWSSSSIGIASITSGGTLTGGTTPGTSTITYAPSTGCPATTTVTVNAPPSAITGVLSVCVGSSTALSDGTSGGTWSSSNTASASVTAGGVVHGAAPGVTTITYTAGGCSVTTLVTVTPPPPSITGGPMVCEGQSVSLHDASAGGTWSTGPSSLATIDGSGILWGVASGTVLVSYTTGTGCTTVGSIIINALSPVTGDSIVCAGLSVTLTDSTDGGAWSSSNMPVATALASGLRTGSVTGVSSGTATITYTLPTGCYSVMNVTVNPAPPAITGPRSVCYGSTITLSDGVTGGTWSSSNSAIAAVNMTTGVVEGATATGGPATISYALAGTGCPAEAGVMVYPVPPAITGGAAVCIGSVVTLADPLPGGVWTSSDTTVAHIDAAGTVTGLRVGTTTISYIFGSCSAGMTMTVSGVPLGISGPSSVCEGNVIALTDATSGGSWSSSSTVAVVGSSSGIVTGAGAGTAVITYTTGTGGCDVTRTITVNVQPGGVGETLCQGISAVFADVPAGGTWISSNRAVLVIDTLTGAAGTPSSGTSTVTYTSAAGCSVSGTVFVNPSPGPVTGTLAICLGFSTTLNDTSSGGPWASSNTSVAVVDGSGNVSGLMAGTSIISYPSGSCSATAVVTVNPAPGFIEGPGVVCSGATISLGDSPGGGTWNSSDPTIASIGLYSGVVMGTNTASVAQTVYITYSLGVGCITSTVITVNPAPAPITGAEQVCVTHTALLFDATVGGAWSSGNPPVAAIGSPLAGAYTGVSAGTATIYYTLPVTGCSATQVVTVNPQPGAITGNPQICLGSSQVYSDIPAGGTWSSSNTLIASVPVAATGLVTGVATGAATITYSLGGCTSTVTVVVNPLPAVFTITGGGNYCDGGTGVPIGLSGSGTGVNYLLYHGATATGTVSGTGGDLSFGLQRVAGVYTVTGVSTSTGCSNVMAGSATVTVMPTVTPAVSIAAVTATGVGDTVCQGTTTTFTPVPVNGGLTPGYQWRVNGVAVGTAGTYTYVPANGDLVSAIMTSNATCPSPATATGTVRMTVWSQELPVAGVSVSPGDTVCQGSSVTLSAMPLYGGLSPAYTWMKNGIASGAGAVYRYEPVNGDMLYLSMVSDYPCRTAGTVTSNVITIGVDTPQLPLVAINANPGTSAGIGLFDTLMAVVTNGGTNPRYQWVVNDVPVAGATSNTFISNNYSYPNEDSVTCLVTSSGECSATSFGWVYISEHPAGVATQTAGGGFTIQPNPNSGSFTVKGDLGTGTDEAVTIEITDMLGQQVYLEQVQAQNGRINERISLGQTIANGMYLLVVRTANGNNVFHIVVEQ